MNAKLFVLAVAALSTAACGAVETLFGDGGTGKTDMTCGGVAPIPVGVGMYTVTMVTNVVDNCGLKPETNLLNKKWNVAYDPQTGIMDLQASAGRPSFGKGLFLCNMGKLETKVQDSFDQCQYQLNRSALVTQTKAGTLSIKFTEENAMKSAGCTPKTDCISTFDMVWENKP